MAINRESCLTVFVGSSSESTDYYEAVCGALEDQGHKVVGWKSSFEKSKSFLATLDEVSETVDAALLIAAPDDLLQRRGQSIKVLRDNVLFEAGLFTGRLGATATSIVVAGDEPVTLPSDLSGICTFFLVDGREHTFAAELRRWTETILARRLQVTAAREIAAQVRGIDASVYHECRIIVIPRIQSILTQAAHGIIDLTPEQYFERIRHEMEYADSKIIVQAVATSESSLRWISNPLQDSYIQQNILAHRRGVQIRRLFLFERRSISAAQAKGLLQQLMAGIPVRCVAAESLSVPIDDFVLFGSPDTAPRAYKAFADRICRERVAGAQMYTDPQHCSDLRRRFNEIWCLAREPRTFGSSIEVPGMPLPPPARHEFPPGLEMSPRWTSVEVISCGDAAKVRGHELHRELKSLVVTTSRGLCVVHVPGDFTVSLRKVKRFMGVDEAHLADPELLLELGLGPGTVCAVLDPVWSMRHLVDQRLFEHDRVATNNGTRNGYFTFDPNELRSARSVDIGDFVERVMDPERT